MSNTAQDAKNSAPSEAYADRLLDAMLETAAEQGWTSLALDRAAKAAGLTSGEVKLAAPHGVASVLDRLGDRAAKAAEARLALPDVDAMKVRDKVAAGVRAYLIHLEPHKAAMKRAAGSPWNMFAGPSALWRAADAVWAGLGDASTDHNWYTKRITLSAVLGSTLLAWLGSDDHAEIDRFLGHRIDDVMEFEKSKKKVQEAFAGLPDLFGLGDRKG